jgi:flagellar capping protein FliD
VAVSALSSLSTGGGMFEVAKVVDQLMTIENAPLNKLNAKVESKQIVLDSVGLLKKSVMTLTEDLKALENFGNFSSKDDVKAVLKRVATSFTEVNQGINEAAGIKLVKGRYTTGALTGDSLVSTLKRVLSDAWFSGVDFKSDLQDNSVPQVPYSTATPRNLVFSELGLSRASDGTVTFDSARFDKMATRIDLVGAFNNGASTKLHAGVPGQYNGLNHAVNFASGIFSSRTDQLNSELYKLSTRVDDLTSKLAITKDRLTQQYSRYNSIIAQLQGSNSYLSSFLASQNKSYG